LISHPRVEEVKCSRYFPRASYCDEDNVKTFIKVNLIQTSFLGVGQLNSRVSMALPPQLSLTRDKKQGGKSPLLITIRFKALIAKRSAGIRLSTSVYGKNKFTTSIGYFIATRKDVHRL
jgi:hypothetical protein